ncbi:MAG: ABC transporter ATP-binding protein [Bacillota bacterium]
MNTLVKAVNIGSLGRGNEWLFKDINLEVNAGEIVVIFGGVDSGKSRLAEILSGCRKPGQGWIERYGPAALATQEFTLYKDLTVEENLEFIRAINDGRSSDLAEIEALTGLNGRERAKARELPVGLRKMLQAAGAVVRGTPLLVFDEPCAGLDRELQRKFRRLAESLAEAGRGVIILTNQLGEAIPSARVFSLTKKGLAGVAEAEKAHDGGLTNESRGWTEWHEG